MPGKLHDLCGLLVCNLHKANIAFALHVDCFNLGLEHGEACTSIRCGIIQTPIHTCQVELIAWPHCVNLVTSQQHFLRSRHLAWLNRAGTLLQRDALVIAIQCLLTIDLPWAFGLTLNARTRLQVFLLCHIKWTARISTLGTLQEQALDLVAHLRSPRHNSVHIYKPVDVPGTELPDGITDWEPEDAYTQLVLILCSHLTICFILPLGLNHEGLI
mmetsp:Transcript_23968/g.44021  ORF Transcript_23968/g.44021 Transcript_23968/m.44021 type:complete len:215 (+) Transcript_23968:1373-2017(+)